MKFKTIFFLFNGIILFSFLFIALMPLIVLGAEYSMVFWGDNWFLALLFLVFISVLDGYFIINWKMFSHLENEDWASLTAYLEHEIYEKKRINGRNIRMMVNSALTVSNLDKISRLEQEVSAAKPALLGKYGTMLGLPYLLGQNHEDGKAFFQECINRSSEKDSYWLRWCHAFLLLSGKEIEEARPHLEDLTAQKKDPVLRLLSLYLFSTIESGSHDQIDAAKSEIIEKFPTRESFTKIVNRSKNSNIIVLLLTNITEDSLDWLYSLQAVNE